MGLIDSHVHLNFPQFKEDFELVMKRAATAGVSGMINIGTDLATSRESVSLSERFSHIFAAVGIHPHDASSYASSSDAIKVLAAHPRVIAIGEIGLDYYRNLSPQDTQLDAFIGQLAIAKTVRKPVILHCRDAYTDTLEVLEHNYITELSGRPPGIIHSFATTPAYAKRFVGQGFALGINNLIGRPDSESIRETVSRTPLDSLVIETDCPFLPPHDRRGDRCEPSDAVNVVEIVAKIKNVDFDTVVNQTTRNLERIFNIQWS